MDHFAFGEKSLALTSRNELAFPPTQSSEYINSPLHTPPPLGSLCIIVAFRACGCCVRNLTEITTLRRPRSTIYKLLHMI